MPWSFRVAPVCKARCAASSPTACGWIFPRLSDKRVQPKGLSTIPRQSVSVLRLTEYRKLGRLLVTTGGPKVLKEMSAKRNIHVIE